MSVVLSTLAAPSRCAQDIRKSRFVAQAAGVPTVESALAFVDAAADPGATHNCWAYRIGQLYRFSDDGEPSGTAGRPILQAIDGQHFDRIVVVVTRWFGGIKLGAGGLVRAYGGCAAECLRTAPRSEIVARIDAECTVEFALLQRVRARLAESGTDIVAESFDGQGATLRLSLPLTGLVSLRALLADLTRGRGDLRILG